jgi:hypothetical protein
MKECNKQYMQIRDIQSLESSLDCIALDLKNGDGGIKKVRTATAHARCSSIELDSIVL